MNRKKLAIFISHPVQYQAPLYQQLAEENDIDLTVYFYSRHGIEESYDQEFNKKFKWDIPLLEGYHYEFLTNQSPAPGFHFFGFINLNIFKKIYKNKFDAVMVNTWSYASDWFVLFATLFTKTPIFLRTENPLNQELFKSKWKIILKKIIFGKLLFPRISAFLYIGEENRKFYLYYGVPESKLFFAPYAVDNDRLISKSQKLESQKNQLQKKLGIAPGKVVILFVGKFIEKKRPLDLLAAYHLMSCDNKALVLVGEGRLRNEIENFIAMNNLENVYLIGFKNQTELSHYYALADILVLSSGMNETWGLVVNEAMCFGLPIIASNMVGCGTNLVKHNENGYIFPLGNIKMFSEYLDDLTKNSEKRKKFGKKSFEIIQKYSYSKTVATIKNILFIV
ncbi:MAG: glycosyltransferase family 4 protein [Parcubacteria group bacterium]|nr:glycosyltransferase family 4 protein [Parcubacteria group bacterium]